MSPQLALPRAQVAAIHAPAPAAAPFKNWEQLLQQLDWTPSYVPEKELFPPAVSGEPWLPSTAWSSWQAPYQSTYADYVEGQTQKNQGLQAVEESLGRPEFWQQLDPRWISGLKLHSATLPLAEFAALVGNLRAARFGRHSWWRQTALLGALDELRHTQFPLSIMHKLLPKHEQFDWTHKFYHTNNWISIAARHFSDEIFITANPIEFAIATNFVFETGFTNLQFVGLSALGQLSGDFLFREMITSFQTDEARHAQMGPATLELLVQFDPQYAQYLLDKWFWRSWHIFAVVTGFCVDYFTPLEKRPYSFGDFMQEWIIEQFLENLQRYGLQKPWYWDQFLQSLNTYHHMVYASAYTYRATCWFDLYVPNARERQWLSSKYPQHWEQMEQVWQQIIRRWEKSDVGNDWYTHGATPVAFCHLCQMVLCHGTPEKNWACTLTHQGEKYIFCSEPCRWIFQQEKERYQHHQDVVKRILTGQAPSNLLELVRQYFQMPRQEWGRDLFNGNYPWMKRERPQ